MAPLIQNPAMAGALNTAEVNFNYKNQWNNVTSPYKTFAISAMTRVGKYKKDKTHWALGLNFFNDQSGDGKLTTTNGNLTLALQIPLNRYNKLGLGLQSGFGQVRINFSEFQWGSQYGNGAYDPNQASGEVGVTNQFGYLDFSSGIVWTINKTIGNNKTSNNQFNKGSFGFSVFHINQPLFSFVSSGDKLNLKYVLHGNYLYSFEDTKFAINPGFMFYRQGPAQQILIGTMVRYSILPESKYTGAFNGGGVFLGAYVRAKDAVVLATMFEFSNITLGFSYDINTSSLRTASNGQGGLEFSLRIVGQSKHKSFK
jgi:type IX secretion system PorP/SprF family membrane protein